MASLCPAAAAQSPPAGEDGPARRFSIGFLPEGSDFVNATVLLEELRDELENRRPLREALERAGYSEIILSPCDGPRDMAQRLAVGEFDLALATGVIYARLRGGDYQPILQTHLPGDFQPPGRQAGVLRRGVVFAGPASPLHALPDEAFPTAERGGAVAMPPATHEMIRKELARSPIAVTWSDSAAGYIYPRLQFAADYGLAQLNQFWFCGSDAEVIKHVVSGLAPIGACRKGELAMLPTTGEGRPRYYRELFETAPFPTDPILVRAPLLPATSDLGSELKATLREYFNLKRKAADGLRLENASPADYEMLRRALDGLEGPERDASPTAVIPAVAPTAPLPTPSPSPAAAPQLSPELKPGATPLPTATPTPVPTQAPPPRDRPALPPLPDPTAPAGGGAGA